MTENVFIKRLKVLYDNLLDDYYNGVELEGGVKAIKLLCHNWEELQKTQDKEEKKLNGG